MPNAVHANKEMFAVHLWGDGDESFEQADQEILFRLDLLFRRKDHLHAGEDQKRAEDQNDEMITDERRAHGYKNRSRNQRADDAVKEHAVLIFRRHTEVAEDQNEDEYIVYRKRLFDHISGQKLKRDLPRCALRIKSRNGQKPLVLRELPQRELIKQVAERERQSIQMPLQMAASRKDTECALRWNMPRSTASISSTNPVNDA